MKYGIWGPRWREPPKRAIVQKYKYPIRVASSMGNVRRVRKVLKQEGASNSLRFRAVRPPVWRRGSLRLQLNHHKELQDLLTRSTQNVINHRDSIIAGHIPPKRINDIFRNKSGGYDVTPYTLSMLGLPLGTTALAGGVEVAVREPNPVGLFLGSSLSMIGALILSGGLITFSETRKARLFSVLKKKIFINNSKEPWTKAKSERNREVVDAAINELLALREENIHQMIQIQDQMARAKPRPSEK
ncbi:MAG: hypothetical protein Q8P05_05520 [Candidatus Diapherotrites archaeon]|nr:hypothetical protein [Candidatus Diapherotrites archaeon]